MPRPPPPTATVPTMGKKRCNRHLLRLLQGPLLQGRMTKFVPPDVTRRIIIYWALYSIPPNLWKVPYNPAMTISSCYPCNLAGRAKMSSVWKKVSGANFRVCSTLIILGSFGLIVPFK